MESQRDVEDYNGLFQHQLDGKSAKISCEYLPNKRNVRVHKIFDFFYLILANSKLLNWERSANSGEIYTEATLDVPFSQFKKNFSSKALLTKQQQRKA